jgi:hypothetical protein
MLVAREVVTDYLYVDTHLSLITVVFTDAVVRTTFTCASPNFRVANYVSFYCEYALYSLLSTCMIRTNVLCSLLLWLVLDIDPIRTEAVIDNVIL